MSATELDLAHATMEAAPEDDAARLGFWSLLAGSELHLLLAGEPDGEMVTPDLFEVDGVPYALVFDREERLAEFSGRVSASATLPGRGLATLLAGQGVGLGLNLGVAPSAFLAPPQAIDWLAETLAQRPGRTEARIEALVPPGALPERLLTEIDRRLAAAAGLARVAWLVGAREAGGGRRHLLAIAGAVPEAEDALAAALGEALVFSGLDAGEMDVTFLRDDHPSLARLDRVGLRFDLPQPEAPAAPLPPGMDPDAPPRLR